MDAPTVMRSDLFIHFEACFWLSLFGPSLGCFLIFRKMSYAGDALAHATLAGISIAFLLAGLSYPILSIGAVASLFVSSFLLRWLEEKWKIPSDLALTLSTTSLFALGLFLMSWKGLSVEHILVGDLFQLNEQGLWSLRIWGLLVFGVVSICWKPLWLSVIDPLLARSLGYRLRVYDALLMGLVAVSIVGLMQTVGLVLVSTYLILPPVAMMPWARSLQQMVVGSVFMALGSSWVALILSQALEIKSGPLFALVGFVVIALSFATSLMRR